MGQTRSTSVCEERWSLTLPLGRFHLPGTTLYELRLPLRPLLPALAANTVFYGLLWALPLIGVPLLKRRRRRRRSLCLSCAYDLVGTTTDACPECGCPRRAARA